MSPQEPLGLNKLDALATKERPTLTDYIEAVSEYVLAARTITDEARKAAQIRLSGVLGRALVGELEAHQPPIANLHAGERKVAGALRTAQADVSQLHSLDGLRFAIEIKPVNLAIGRAIWNRFGDIRSFAVNIHLKFPFAVVGGLLTIPTIELVGDRHKDTRGLIERAVNRLVRAGGRRTEGDAAHLLEAVGVVAYDPIAAVLIDDLPPAGSGLRWEEFVHALAVAYDSRFED